MTNLNQWVRADEVEAKENAAYNAGYADGRTDGWILSDPWSHEDWQLLERVAAELCRQRGWKWADQGNDVRVALTTAAANVIRAASGPVPVLDKDLAPTNRPAKKAPVALPDSVWYFEDGSERRETP